MPVLDHHSKKVFCIGFNKTGTGSLHNLFKSFGLNSTHNDHWTQRTWVSGAGKYFKKFDCYSDGEAAEFRRLVLWYPASVFILNTRDERPWMQSRVKHVMRHNDALTPAEVIHSPDYGWMAKSFFADPRENMKMWIAKKRIYEQMVRLYFEDSDKLIEVDVTREANWTGKIAGFLQAHDITIDASNTNDIHRNKRETVQIRDQAKLRAYFQMIDEVLAADRR